jgi:hypothetical protein
MPRGLLGRCRLLLRCFGNGLQGICLDGRKTRALMGCVEAGGERVLDSFDTWGDSGGGWDSDWAGVSHGHWEAGLLMHFARKHPSRRSLENELADDS